MTLRLFGRHLMSTARTEIQSAAAWVRRHDPAALPLAVRAAVRKSGQTTHNITRMTGALRAALRDAGWVWPEPTTEVTRKNP